MKKVYKVVKPITVCNSRLEIITRLMDCEFTFSKTSMWGTTGKAINILNPTGKPAILITDVYDFYTINPNSSRVKDPMDLVMEGSLDLIERE